MPIYRAHRRFIGLCWLFRYPAYFVKPHYRPLRQLSLRSFAHNFLLTPSWWIVLGLNDPDYESPTQMSYAENHQEEHGYDQDPYGIGTQHDAITQESESGAAWVNIGKNRGHIG